MIVNAFCTADPKKALTNSGKVYYCGNERIDDERIVTFVPFGEVGAEKNIYIADMTDFDSFEAACDHILENDACAIVRAAYDLTEAGIVEAKFKLSPIMLLHKLGVLNRCMIAGGVCLDNDDLDLMAQEDVPLVITPTASAGYGHGFAPVFAAHKRGIRIGIGTFDGRYNPTHDPNAEAAFLKLTASADMRRADVFTDADVEKFFDFSL